MTLLQRFLSCIVYGKLGHRVTAMKIDFTLALAICSFFFHFQLQTPKKVQERLHPHVFLSSCLHFISPPADPDLRRLRHQRGDFALVGFSYVVGDISSCLTQLLGRLFFDLPQEMVEDLVTATPKKIKRTWTFERHPQYTLYLVGSCRSSIWDSCRTCINGWHGACPPDAGCGTCRRRPPRSSGSSGTSCGCTRRPGCKDHGGSAGGLKWFWCG